MRPVLGSLSEAEEGTLKVFVGGPAPLAERWTPLLSALGSPIHVGPLGAGASAKLVANATLFGTLAVLGEAVALADGLGLSRDVTFDGAGGDAARRSRRAPPPRDRGRRLPAALRTRARQEGRRTDHRGRERRPGVDVRVLEAARAWLVDAEEAGLGDRDYSTVLARIIGTD